MLKVEFFDKNITPIYDYFKSIGVDGQKADKLVDTCYHLLPKRTLIERIIAFVLNKILPCWFPARDTDIKRVIHSIEILANNCRDEISADALQRGEFVKAVLKRIADKTDPHLETLASINRFRELLPHSIHPNKQQYVRRVDDLYTKYAAGQEVGVQAELPDATRSIEAAGFLSWNAMTRDPLQQIFRKLGPEDLAAVSKTCKSWNRVATSKPVWDGFRNNGFSQFMPCLPEAPLEANLWEVFRLQRAACQAIEANDAYPKMVMELSDADGKNATFIDSTDPKDIGVRDGDALVIYHVMERSWQRADFFFAPNIVTQWMQIGDTMYRILYVKGGTGLSVVQNNGATDPVFEDLNINVHGISQANNKLLIRDFITLHIVDLAANRRSQMPLRNMNLHHEVYLHGVCVYTNERNRNDQLVPSHTLLDFTEQEPAPKTIDLDSSFTKVLTNTSTTLFGAHHHELNAFDIETGKKLGIYKPHTTGHAPTPSWNYPVVASSCSTNEYYPILKAVVFENLLISMTCTELHIFDLYSRKHLKTLRGYDIKDFLVKRDSIFLIAADRDTRSVGNYKVFEYKLRP